MKTFKTPKGTELPILNLRGKDYLQVMHRLVWFREERPTWGIETELLAHDNQGCIARAVIKDETGRVIAISHKTETAQGFPDFIEKGETGAIGRALALIGFGTQFCADELDEGERLADSPVPTKSGPVSLKAVSGPGDYVVKIGKKFIGKRLDQCGPFAPDGTPVELLSYAKWLNDEALKKDTKLSGEALETFNAIHAFAKECKAKSVG